MNREFVNNEEPLSKEFVVDSGELRIDLNWAVGGSMVSIVLCRSLDEAAEIERMLRGGMYQVGSGTDPVCNVFVDVEEPGKLAFFVSVRGKEFIFDEEIEEFKNVLAEFISGA